MVELEVIGRTAVMPSGWADGRYPMLFPEQLTATSDDRQDPEDQVDLENLKCAKEDRLEDWSWRLASIRGAHYAFTQGNKPQVQEVLKLAWKDEWIPIHLADFKLVKSLEAVLAATKVTYFKRSPQSRQGQALALVPALIAYLDSKTKTLLPFIVRSINKYAQVKVGGDVIDVVHCQFLDTYEHASMLWKTEVLWRDVYQCRQNSLQDKLKSSHLLDSHRRLLEDALHEVTAINAALTPSSAEVPESTLSEDPSPKRPKTSPETTTAATQ